jgi:hypothetical protein
MATLVCVVCKTEIGVGDGNADGAGDGGSSGASGSGSERFLLLRGGR